MLKDGWKVDLTHIGCAEKPEFKKVASKEHTIEVDPTESDHN